MIKSLFCAVCSAVCFLYGVCILQINDGTNFFATWFVLGFFFLLPIFDKKLNVWKSISRPIRYILIGTLGLLISTFLFVEACIVSGFKYRNESNLDYIIVLGAQVLNDGSPSVILLTRLEKTLAYLNEHPGTICIVTGGKGKNEPITEALAMKKYLLSKGITESRIITENNSSNTSENISNSMKIIDLKNKNIGIVTNDFHVYRAIKIAKKCNINKVFGIPCETPRMFLPNNMLREFFGILKNKVCKNM